MARWLAVLFVAGSTLSLIAMLLPHWARQDTTATVISAMAAYPAAGVLLFAGERLPRVAFHLLLALGTLIITLGVYFGNDGTGSLTAAVFYIWVALYAFTFFSRRWAVVHIAVVGIGYGTVLSVRHVHAGAAQWLLVVGTTVASGMVVAALVDEVRAVARRDGLTGLWNRRALEEDLDRHLKSARRDHHSVTLAIIDLDDFKDHNTTLGHHGADRLLVELAHGWSAELRPDDCLARYGGDEFALVCPRSTVDDVEQLVRRLRSVAPSPVGFSAGIAGWAHGESAEELERRADDALLDAKRSGRASTLVAPGPGPAAGLAGRTPGTGALGGGTATAPQDR
jgi:diguanylate cyclase (GGDEF)-like protein